MATRTLEVRLTGDSVVLQQSIDKAEKKAAKAEIQLELLRKRLDDVQASTDRTGRSQSNFAEENETLGNRLRATTSSLGSFDHKIAAVRWPALIAGAGYAAEGVGTLGAGVVGLGAALAPLSGTLAAYPALFGAMGQAAGVVAVAQVGELSGALEGNKSSLEKLTPAAKAFVGDLKEMEPAYKRMQKTVQQDLFTGVGKGLDSAKGNFGAFESVLDGTAKALGGVTEKAGALVGSKGFGRDLESIGGSNTRILERLGGAGIAFGDSLRHVMVEAEPLTEWLAGSVDHFAHYIDGAAKAGRQTGDLSHFFAETRDTLEVVGPMIGDLATGFWNVGKAAKPLGDEILKSLNEQAGDFSEWTGSLNGQNELRDYFREAKPGIFEVGRLAKDASADVLELSKGQGFFHLTHALRTELLPVFTEVAKSTTATFGPVMVEALTEIGKLIGSLSGTSGPLTLFVESVTRMVHLINGAFDAVPGLQAFVVTLAGIATVSKAMRFTGMVTGLTTSLGLSKKLLANIGLIEAEQGAVTATASGAGALPVAAVPGSRDLRTPVSAAGEFGERQALRDAGLLSAGGAGIVSSARNIAGRLSSSLMSYGVGGLVVGQVVKEVGHSEIATRVGDAIQGAGVGAAIGTAIAPGIGTGIGAALGGLGGALYSVFSSDDSQKRGEEYGEAFLRGYQKNLPRVQGLIRSGFIGTAASKTRIGDGSATPGAESSGFSYRAGSGLKGERSKLESRLDTKLNDQQRRTIEAEIASINRAIASIQKSRLGFADAMKHLRSDAITGMGGIDRALDAGLARASQAWQQGTPVWRKHTADAMRAAVVEIRQGMHSGTISAEEGREKIGDILGRLHLVTGKDPLGLAEQVAKEFRQTGKITSAGADDFVTKLKQMPKGAREQTRAATTAMLQAWAQGHPKLEAQVKQLTDNIASRFGQSGKAAAAAQRRAMRTIIEQVGGASSSVAAGLTTIGTDLAGALKALGAHDIPQFKIQAEALDHHHGLAGGGIARVRGVGLEDTVPLRINGSLSAVVAPGEDVMVVNRHQRPKLDEAVASRWGVNGMSGFFAANTRPHYMASGGITGTTPITHPVIGGGGQGMREGSQHGVDDVYHAAVKFYEAHNGIGRVIANGDRMDALHKPYLWGGGHGPTASRNGAWDCSGGTSELAVGSGLKGPDFNFAPMVSGGFTSWGLPGKGDFSVLANSEHVYSVLKTKTGWRAIGTSDSNPGGGYGWIDDYTFRPGFTIRHADFGAGTGTRQGRRDSKGQKQVKGMAGGGMISGKVSFFGGGEEASGMNTSQPGIAVNLHPGTDSGWNNDTTQGWITQAREGHPVYAAVKIAGHSANLPITDLGPAGFTGRAIDVTEGGVAKLGFSTSNFPTDAVGTATILGAGGAGGHQAAATHIIPKGHTVAGGTSAGAAPAKEIKAAKALGAAHAANPKVSRNVRTSPLPTWAAGLPRFQREELEGRGTTLPERETILGNAETNATFEESIAQRAVEAARQRYEEDPDDESWAELEAASGRVRGKRGKQAAASTARQLFEKAKIRHTTKRVKQINWQLAHAAGRLSAKEINALKEQRAEIVEQRSSARGEAQGATEAIRGYGEESVSERAENDRLREAHEEEEREKQREQREHEREDRRSRGELRLLQAEGTKGTRSDDLEALDGLKKIAEEELKEAKESGDLGEIVSATQNLTQATENLKEAAQAAFEEETEGQLALAELTEGLADDLEVLHRKLTFAEGELQKSKEEGDWAEIAKWAHEVKGLTDAIKSDEGSEATAQLAEAMKSLQEELVAQRQYAESVQATSAAVAMRVVADVVSNHLGAKATLQANTVSNGSVGSF